MRDVLELLGEGKSLLYKVTVPEGLTSQQIVERLLAEPNLSGEITQIPAEGSLLPDTYRVSKGMSRQDLIDQMQRESAEFLAKAWEKRASDLRSQRRAKPLSRVHRRERNGAGRRAPARSCSIRQPAQEEDAAAVRSDDHLRHRRRAWVSGPPDHADRHRHQDRLQHVPHQWAAAGAICNPGRETIEATLNPAATNDLYFVADGTGGHTFSETLAAHNAAVQNWRKIENRRPQGRNGRRGPASPKPRTRLLRTRQELERPARRRLLLLPQMPPLPRPALSRFLSASRRRRRIDGSHSTWTGRPWRIGARRLKLRANDLPFSFTARFPWPSPA